TEQKILQIQAAQKQLSDKLLVLSPHPDDEGLDDRVLLNIGGRNCVKRRSAFFQEDRWNMFSQMFCKRWED
ncbi:hypothetical protein ACEV7R_23800, partial [Vibrio parahaemolyticus]